MLQKPISIFHNQMLDDFMLYVLHRRLLLFNITSLHINVGLWFWCLFVFAATEYVLFQGFSILMVL